jgi:hypothetical protein
MMGHVACMKDMRNAYRVLVGNLKRRDRLGRRRCRWENIKIDLRYIKL